MTYITPIVYVLINIIHAVWHSYLITKKNRLIKSAQKLSEYFIASVLVAAVLIFFHLPVLPMILFAFLTRVAFFAPLLNVLRGGFDNIFYESISSNKKKWTFDWVLYKIGLPLWIYYLLFFAAYITYLIIYLT